MVANIAHLNDSKKYRVSIPLKGKKIIVGLYDTYEDACKAKHAADLVAKVCLLKI